MTEERAVFRPRWPPAWSDVRHLYVVGIDPGRETGWAVVRVDLVALVQEGFTALALRARDPEVFAWACGSFLGSEPQIVDQVLALYRGVWEDGVWDRGADSDVMVGSDESFTLRIFSSDESLLSPVRILAMLRYAGRDLPFPRVQHSPSDAKRVVTDERLRYLGMYALGPDHLRDATRQAVLTARKMVETHFRMTVMRHCAWLNARRRRA